MSGIPIPRLRLRGQRPAWLTPLSIAAAAIITLLLTAAPIRIAGANPSAAFSRYLIKPLTSANGIDELLLAATPLLFTGLAVALAFRCGYSNIGAEGQFLAGGIGATIPGLYLSDLPAVFALPLAIVGGAVAGTAWAVVPAWLRRKGGIDEVATTLLLNPVALLLVQGLLNGPWRNSETGFPESDRLGDGYTIGPVTAGSRVHWGFVLAVVLIAIAYVVFRHTALGVRMSAVGQAPKAARFSGIDADTIVWRAALVSGAIAGLGGCIQVLAVQHQLATGISNSYGYTGIVVATLGGLGAVGVGFVALLLADITVGAQSASRVLALPPQMGQIVSSVLLLTVVAALVLRKFKVVLTRNETDS